MYEESISNGMGSFKNLYDIDWEFIVSGTIQATARTEQIAQFKITHSLRVRDIVVRLASAEPEIDPQKAEIMALIHDMYRYADDENHGASAALGLRKFYVEPYLKRGRTWMMQTMYASEKEEWAKVYTALTKHSDKAIKAFSVDSISNPYLRLLQDADVLDYLNFKYIEDYYKLFYIPTEDDKQFLHLPIIKKYIIKVERYDGKCVEYKNMLLMLLRELNLHAKQESTNNINAAYFYEKEILKLMPRVIREGTMDKL